MCSERLAGCRRPRSAGSSSIPPSTSRPAAAYPFHLCEAHPFVDGNKRTAFAAADVFLPVTGYRVGLLDQQAHRLTMRLARGATTKDQLAATLQEKLEPL